MGISMRKGKIYLAWALICCLFLAGCGGAGKSAGDTAVSENMAEGQAGAEGQAAAEGQAGAEEPAAAEGQAAVGERAGEETAPEKNGNAETQGSRNDTAPQTDKSADSEDRAVESARREEEVPADKAAGKLSILGDSISTFDGWIPEGYSCYFPMSGEITEVGQTWWQKVLRDTGMELCVNSSSSGSTCVGDSASIDNFQYGCSECRLGNLIGQNGCFPDIIVVYMGTNDVLKSVPIGDNDGTRAVEEGMVENFSDAYSMMLDKLTAYYPNAEIYCCTLPPMGDWGPESGPVFVPFVNGQELTSEEYGQRIETIASAKGCRIIDLKNCGITMENMEQYVTDGIHMNPEGMELIYKAVVAAIN